MRRVAGSGERGIMQAGRDPRSACVPTTGTGEDACGEKLVKRVVRIGSPAPIRVTAGTTVAGRVLAPKACRSLAVRAVRCRLQAYPHQGPVTLDADPAKSIITDLDQIQSTEPISTIER